jgi:hypothetical protein
MLILLSYPLPFPFFLPRTNPSRSSPHSNVEEEEVDASADLVRVSPLQKNPYSNVFMRC